MMFRRHIASKGRALAVVAVSFCLMNSAFAAEYRYAVVPVSTIYPGEMITEARVREVEVTNPNLAPGYAQSVQEVVGIVTKRTLVAGRTIPVGSLQEPFAVTRGSTVRLVAKAGSMTISASGTPLADAIVGDVIRVRNLDSGVTVSGTVMADGSVEVIHR